jgi:hypothetical protein
VFPAFDGEPAEIERFHQQQLRECQGVILCWANTSEIWARARCRELRSWEKIGRSNKFAVRGLVAGPPPRARKAVLIKFPPRDEIDIVVDLTGHDKPSLEALESVISAFDLGTSLK